jgi:hypothetical protein
MKKTRSKSKTISTLDKYIKKLRETCHNKGCTKNNSCPRNCCSDSLGLHTAIIWELAEEIDELATEIEWSDITDKLLIKSIDRVLGFISWILDEHSDKFKSNQYKVLYSSIQYTYTLLHYIDDRLNNDIKSIDEIFKS